MYKIVVLLILCSSFNVSCKSINSGTKDALYQGEDGTYYYAWKGKDNKLCMSWCSSKPESIEEAIEGSICYWEVKYTKQTPNLPLNIDAVIDVTKNIAFLYDDTESRPYDEVRDICLTEEVINRVKRDKDARIQVGGFEKGDIDLQSKGYSRIETCYSCPEKEYKEHDPDSCIIKNDDLVCMSAKFAVVKEVKVGLSFDEALKYCKTPNKSTYVIDWNKVRLGSVSVNGEDINLYTSKPIWVDDPSGKFNVMQDDKDYMFWGSGSYNVSKNAKDIYTVCLTPEDNLRGVYIYRVK